MAHWHWREELSAAGRLRRSYYELLRDQLDQYMVRHALIDSYLRFKERDVPYPFVEKRELKPRAIIPDIEYEHQNAFLVIFLEDAIPEIHKKYIRFFDVNKTTKTNLLRTKTLPLSDDIDRYHKYLESARFFDFLKVLLPVDYALLIQRDDGARSRNRYKLSHFHVRIDWPIADAAEDLARKLRYISKDLYEKGDKYAEDVQKKFFEYYGLPVMVGGRRTAACVAAQYLRKVPCISTVYAGSAETRALIRISERGTAKLVLMKFTEDEVKQIASTHGQTLRDFRKNHAAFREGKDDVCIVRISYACTSWAKYPEDGKLREIKPDVNWLSVDSQQIMPMPGVRQAPPLPMNIVYT